MSNTFNISSCAAWALPQRIWSFTFSTSLFSATQIYMLKKGFKMYV